MMTSKQRILSALAYRGYDRLPTFYQCTPEFDQELKQHLGVSDDETLEAILGVDMKDVNPHYIGPELKRYPDESWEGLFGERYANIPHETGAYPEAVFLPYKDVTSVDALARLRFPSADWYEYSALKQQCEQLAGYAVVFGNAGMPDFINGIARCRGVEQVLLDIGTEDPVYLRLMEKRHEFFYTLSERALQAAEGLVDILALGEDYGSQRGLLLSPQKF
ncbi:MAG: hypothetical protein ACETWB_07000, partial [Anaerolineae bacterium]